MRRAQGGDLRVGLPALLIGGKRVAEVSLAALTLQKNTAAGAGRRGRVLTRLRTSKTQRRNLIPLCSLMLEAPFSQSIERGDERAAVVGKTVFGRKHGSLMELAPGNDAVSFEIAQML